MPIHPLLRCEAQCCGPSETSTCIVRDIPEIMPAPSSRLFLCLERTRRSRKRLDAKAHRQKVEFLPLEPVQIQHITLLGVQETYRLQAINDIIDGPSFSDLLDGEAR